MNDSPQALGKKASVWEGVQGFPRPSPTESKLFHIYAKFKEMGKLIQ